MNKRLIGIEIKKGLEPKYGKGNISINVYDGYIAIRFYNTNKTEMEAKKDVLEFIAGRIKTPSLVIWTNPNPKIIYKTIWRGSRTGGRRRIA